MPKFPIPVIDLFAGPGGLSEGFSSLTSITNQSVFKVKVSIESDEHAHRTLELRAFLRCFPRGKAPQDYYDYVAGRLTRDALLNRHPQQAKIAREEAWLGELGKESTPNDLVDERIKGALNDSTEWVLIGGPPCQAYSLVGRSRIRGKSQSKYNKDPRHFLYREYLRILAKHAPPIFVMENVKGLLSATVKKELIFQRILSDLAHPAAAIDEASQGETLEYRLVSVVNPTGNLLGEFEPEDFVVKTERFGIPQARHRIIILGIRSDFQKIPRALTPLDAPNIDDVIWDLPRIRSGLSKQRDSSETWRETVRGIVDEKWFSNGCIEDDMRQALTVAANRVRANLNRGGEYSAATGPPSHYPDWFFDPKLGGVLNHSSRGHISADLHRYFFASVFAKKNSRAPLLQDFPKPLLPKHKNVREALKVTKFNDRFRVQLKGRPSTTVVSHISKDGHYFIHYDPTQCRSLTVREAARLQTFPDNYFFEGPRTEQYKQVGNAVPPLLARQIAEIVAELFD
ncbi:MAG TPA: DNA cytosine methyltransferase [Pyrinomonadaceae bacterium]|nr:DNA cytosine methyltransferase [Pyrinomonadaceae bacterium]